MPGGVLVAARPPIDPIVSPPETIRFTWTSPAGRVTDFSSSNWGNEDSGFFTLDGALGLDMPVFEAFTDTPPILDGEVYNGFRTAARDIAIPMRMYAGDRTTFKAMRSRLFRDMAPPRDANSDLGYLSVIDTDGEVRSIPGYYVDGLTGSLDGSDQNQKTIKTVLQIRCPGAYFLGETRSVEIPFGKSGTWLPYGVGAHPYQVSANQVLGNTKITNTGDVDAYAVYTIKGPCSSISLYNANIDKFMLITQALDADDIVVINTEKGKKSITLNGANIMNKRSPNSVLWPIIPGDNYVTFNLAGATSATKISFTYRQRWLAGR